MRSRWKGSLKRRGLTQGNKLAINRFLDFIESEGIGIPRRLTYVYWLKHIGMLKRFYKWLRGTDDYPPEVKWIRLLAEKMAESCLRKSSRTTMLRPWLTLQIVPETERWF
jgi:hypothetical protein